MGTNGSTSPPHALPTGLALLAWPLGLAGMLVGMAVARPLGVHAALFVAESFLALPGMLLLASRGIPLARGLALTRLSPRGWALSLLLGGAFWIGSVGLLELQYAAWPPPPGFLEDFRRLHDALRPTGPVQAVLSVGAIALAPAVCEEILFRGVLLPAFQRPLGTWAAILLSAGLFGVIHLDQTSAGPYTFYRVPFTVAVAVGLGLVRVRSGSLVPGLVAHAVLNTITFVAVLLGASTDAPEAANLVQGVLLLLGGVVATAVLLRWFPRPPDAV
jgi:membrane protease YdiL (CAAX protease family)